MAWAEEKSDDKEENDDGVIGAVKSLFDPNEKTKSGKVLPKAYLKRTADAAKESIREYLGSWRGNQTIAQEESYVALVKAVRYLANFYSKAEPSAPLPGEVKSEILDYLNTAEDFL
ncbi:photosystem II D1 precursor processing protein PSB27-H2, chloroplastic [Trifolium repens]|nr:photosystem II D1 precursor processing protein PSB27-H2, chloroplastic [Trifolium repens]